MPLTSAPGFRRSPGEVLLSSATSGAAGLDTAALETRRLQLKGRQEAVDAWVIPVGRDG